MTELTRDYATLTRMYTDLLSKKEDSQIAANLERRQIGEQFKLARPGAHCRAAVQPGSAVMNLIGMAAGLAIGARC